MVTLTMKKLVFLKISIITFWFYLKYYIYNTYMIIYMKRMLLELVGHHEAAALTENGEKALP